jgi:hypothetical protein
MLIKNVFTLMSLGFIVPINAIHAEIPVAVLTKTSSACAIASNGNANPLVDCFYQQIELIDKYIDSNLRFAPIVKKEQWQQMKKKIDKQCKSENNDAEDPFNNVGYVGCIRNEHSRFNRELLKFKGEGK